MGFLKKLWNDEEGATATEYAIIVAILGVSLVIILVTFRGSISGFFDNFAGEVAGSTE
ncbi:MAG: Flp family type IVb pilin [Myxococcota bacterium]|nr:Flp family type IVb pilin [Myxococcota bacterium]